MTSLGRWRLGGLLLLVVAVLSAALTARLGVWQLDRARQKLDLQQQILSRAALVPLPQSMLARNASDAQAQQYRRTSLRGRWLSERTIYLDNRQMNSRQGFYVLTPLLLDEGDAVLVQRGWSPRDFADRSRLVPLDTPAGEVTVTGRIAPPPSRLFAFGGAELGRIRQNVDLEALAREIGVPLRPLSVQQTDLVVTPAIDSAQVGDLLQRQWPAPAADVSKNQGYALQWFALCALITGLYVWFQLLRPRLARPHG
ncbi:MAG: SURF1 family protein [Betaproteobacteria bacterium]|nr:SURF1 family protein [Betaproteobacteria bacterium]